MDVKHSLEMQLDTVLQQHDLIPDGGKVLVAVSGGADSVCLLHALLAVIECGANFTLEVAHLDHGLRRDSAEDARFVVDLCQRLNVKCHRDKVDVAALARQRKQGVEEAGRAARRHFLQQLANDYRCDCVALAHHQDDQAETVLLRLTRGCGVSGLVAMRWKDGLFIRPLLGVSRQQIVHYLKQREIDHVEDESNSSLVYARNRIRHQVLPALSQINSAASVQLARLAQIVIEEESCWQQQVDAAMRRISYLRGDELRLSCCELSLEHVALRRRIIRASLAQVRGDLLGIEMVHIEAILGLLHDGRPQRELSLPQVWVARRYDELLFRVTPAESVDAFSVQIDAPGSYAMPDGRVLRVGLGTASVAESVDRVEFNAAQVQFPLWLRSVLPGDRISSVGMTGRKKVKKIFAENRLEHEQRRSALALGHREELLWLLGLQRCGDYRVNKAEINVLSCEIVSRIGE